MRRTAGRPLPAGRMLPGEALGFGVVLAVGAVLVMGLAVNWVAAELLALTIAFYVFVYTVWLKRRTPQNIVIGGAAGAFPPMIGWAAMSGRRRLGRDRAVRDHLLLDLRRISGRCRCIAAGEAEAAGVPMLPVVAGPARDEAADADLYTLVLWPVVLSPLTLLGVAPGLVYAAAVGLLLSLIFTGDGGRRASGSDKTVRGAADVRRSRCRLSVPGSSALLLLDRGGAGWV